MIKVSPDKPADVEQAVLEQFTVIDESISWADVESSELHDQYNIR
jgi:hypothetical protein